jgi:putative transposase
MARMLIFVVSFGARVLRAACRRRAGLVLENLALRQQVTALTQAGPRPRLDDIDRAFWVTLRHSWSEWTSRLLIVNPETVARWHRDRFRRSWARISQRRSPGRPRIDADIRRLIQRMAQDG